MLNMACYPIYKELIGQPTFASLTDLLFHSLVRHVQFLRVSTTEKRFDLKNFKCYLRYVVGDFYCRKPFFPRSNTNILR